MLLTLGLSRIHELKLFKEKQVFENVKISHTLYLKILHNPVAVKIC